MNVSRILSILSIALLMMVAAPSAMAASASQTGYDEASPLGQVQDIAGAGAEGPGTASTQDAADVQNTQEASTLPFTGLDLGIVLALGAVLAGAGFLMRRATHPTS